MKKILCILVGLLFIFSTSAFTVDTIVNKNNPDTKVTLTFSPVKISAVADMDVVNQNNVIKAAELKLLDTFVTNFSYLTKALTEPTANSPPSKYLIKHNKIYQTCTLSIIPIIIIYLLWLIYKGKGLDLKSFYLGTYIFAFVTILMLFLVPYIADRAMNNNYYMESFVPLFSG